jgi:NAD-dependent dihydropyrimidine dehydrogenase PreA subunit
MDDSGTPGAWLPVVDHGRCEAERDCVRVCPVDVFEVRRIGEADFAALSALGRLRSRAHRRMTAYAVRPEACTGCGACVTACPETAVELVPCTP